MKIKRIVFVKRAPFEYLDLSFENANVVSLTGINGAGKTTILSYIADAFYEMARTVFYNEFSDKKEHKFYRISSAIYNYQESNSSLVFINFTERGEEIKYIDYYGPTSENDFLKLSAYIDNAITYKDISGYFAGKNMVKRVICKKDIIKKLFSNGICTFFPAYRYEEPGYLNDVYRINLNFKNASDFSGYLPNPLEIVSDLPQIANWIMDVVLDSEIYETTEELNPINNIFSEILKCKTDKKVRLGIGKRHLGGARIQIVEDTQEGHSIYPSIFNISSGEAALLCIFGELLRQADKIRKPISSIEGIVLIDEVDKNLHIRMQKEVLPNLMKMFPNIQFIITTHSTYVNIGLKEVYGLKCKILDIDCGGLECKADENGIFTEAYETMVSENENYLKAYNEVKNIIKKNNVPYVITEGKTDWKHIKNAIEKLNIDNLNIEFYEYETILGDTKLVRMLMDLSHVTNSRPIIGVFDRDNLSNLGIDGIDKKKFVHMGNNVYAMVIPSVNIEQYGTDEISIEHYYSKKDLIKYTEDHRRLFLGEEFYEKGISKDSQYITRIKSLDKKTKVNGVIDEKVFDIFSDPEQNNSVALSKDDFANLIYKKASFADGFDFSQFQLIIDVMKDVCKEIEKNI